MAYPDDLNYTDPERTELLEIIRAAIASYLVDAEGENLAYSQLGRKTLRDEIQTLIDAALPPAA